MKRVPVATHIFNISKIQLFLILFIIIIFNLQLELIRVIAYISGNTTTNWSLRRAMA